MLGITKMNNKCFSCENHLQKYADGLCEKCHKTAINVSKTLGITFNECVSLGYHLSFIDGFCECCGLPKDYSTCDECGCDHSYERAEAEKFHSQEAFG